MEIDPGFAVIGCPRPSWVEQEDRIGREDRSEPMPPIVSGLSNYHGSKVYGASLLLVGVGGGRRVPVARLRLCERAG